MNYKIAIFENEHIEVEGAFEYLNYKDHFNGKLNWKFFVSSQEIGDLQKLKEYHIVVIDISLSSNSKLDGFALIEKIEKEISPIPNIIIVTGQEISEGYEKEYGIKPHPFVEKPLNFKKLKTALLEFISL